MNSFEPVSVLVVGSAARLPGLATFLPAGWLVLRRERLAGTPQHPDLVVLIEPDSRAVAEASLQHPDAAVIAVLSPLRDHDDVVAVLDAGADACVRSNNGAIVAAHAEACHRRRLASPWQTRVA
jgi:hypothetical protein